MTAHSLNPVPFVLSAGRPRASRSRDGVLADVAPTLLEFAGLPPGRHDRALALPRRSPDPVIASAAEPLGGPRPVNPILAIGQIIVSIALIVAILLQARAPGCRARSVAIPPSTAAVEASRGGSGSSRSCCSSCS